MYMYIYTWWLHDDPAVEAIVVYIRIYVYVYVYTNTCIFIYTYITDFRLQKEYTKTD
jgi:hypothetical protein